MTKGNSFEKDLEELEGIVEALEEGGLSLDDSLKQFEKGIALRQRCEKALSEAEKKIELLTRESNGDLKTSAFGDKEEDDEDGEVAGDEVKEEEEGELLF